MTWDGSFEERLAEIEAAHDVLLTPSQMCQVVVGLLKVAGAGLVMSHRVVRLPVGASSRDARVAEEIQATLGSGPCLSAEATKSILLADAAELTDRWPVYASELIRRTPYRATLSFPIVYAGRSFAALNLYSDQTTWTLEHELDVIQAEMVEAIGVRLLLGQVAHPAGPGSDPAEPHPRRRQVWNAAGLLQEAGAMSLVDAVALLRGHAFRTGQLVDDVSLDVVQGNLPTATLLGQDTSPQA